MTFFLYESLQSYAGYKLNKNFYKYQINKFFFIFSNKGYDLSAKTSAFSNCNNHTNGTHFSEHPLNDAPIVNLSRPKNEIAWNYRATDLKPLQNYTDYVPVYGDKNKTANNEERWRILGKKRIDLLSKYGYSSHRETKATEIQTAHGKWHATDNNKHITFDNCYILGETKLTPYQTNQIDAKTQNRHSFCEYKPFSARKIDFPKLKFYTPMDYKSIHFNQDLNENIDERMMQQHQHHYHHHQQQNSSIDSDRCSMLPLIGESASNVLHHLNQRMTATTAAATATQSSSPNKMEDMSIGPFCDQETIKAKEIESKMI